MREPKHYVKDTQHGRRKYSDKVRAELWERRMQGMKWEEVGAPYGLNRREAERQAKLLCGGEDSKTYRPRIIRNTRKWNFHDQDVVSIY